MVIRTFNPIIRESDIKKTLFQRIPVPDEGREILLRSTVLNAQLLRIARDKNVEISRIRKGRYDKLVEIDMLPHNICFSSELLSNDNVSLFKIEVSASAYVTDSKMIYQRQVTDVCKYLESQMTGQLREIAARREINHASILMADIRQSLESREESTVNGVALTGIDVQVRSDKKYEEYVQTSRDLKYKADLEREKVAAGQEIQKMIPNQAAAVFSEVAAGNISAEEAIIHLKETSLHDNEEALKQFNAIKSFVESAMGQDLVDTDNARRVVTSLISRIMASGYGNYLPKSEQMGDGTENRTMEDKQLYREFGEDEG